MEEHADSSLQEGLLNEYFAELGSLIGELKQKRAMVESGALIYTEQEKARCHALVLSAQRMLEIVYFEIHYNDSSTRDYQDFQQYTRYKEALFLVKEDFSRLVATPESPERPSGGDGAEEASDTPTKRPDIPPRLSTGRREGVIQHLDQSASLQTQASRFC
ncbi:hypothetical protein OIY81_2920 [Cryptosporidium canis]|uniref:Uncharacterized protein n=1 Tax=Cryptosporidium canis TaxID=195482 RepID=A0ABQ8P521_9CRYT|nr:hypothetical protein OIY81_2920 [Cryptosporidium canis]KAJ1608521.1 hypothetical protein OJ252_2496 [Cryptosporidium canis]